MSPLVAEHAAPTGAPAGGRGSYGPFAAIVVHGGTEALTLVDALARVHGVAPPAIALCGDGDAPPASTTWASRPSDALPTWITLPPRDAGVDALAQRLHALGVAEVRACVVLPDRGAPEPDAYARLACVAIDRALAGRRGPNVLVEVDDPEAALEFAGLGVSTVFYAGYLRAALLAHACVDLGVFQLVLGLLQGRVRVRLLPVAQAQRGQRFAAVAAAIERDGQGRPATVVGLQLAASGGPRLAINPGPTFELGPDALALVALVHGDASGEPSPPRRPAAASGEDRVHP